MNAYCQKCGGTEGQQGCICSSQALIAVLRDDLAAKNETLTVMDMNAEQINRICDNYRIELAVAQKAIVDIEGFSEENWDDETRRQVHIARMKFDGPYAAQNPPRCKVTGNPCGTDTWASGQSCDCDNCQAYLANPKGGNDDE